MKYDPKPYQSACIKMLTEKPTVESAGLFLDMGLGKTGITLTAIQQLIDDFAVTRVLVIAPLRVAQDTWSKEAGKWDHLSSLRVSTVLGTARQRIAALETPADLYVINRENVTWLCDPKESGLKHWPFDLVVIDELSSFKNGQSKRWRAFKKRVPPTCPVWGLTGTPAPNGYMDLWAQIYLLDRGRRLGSTIGAFRDRYFTAGARRGHIVYEWRIKPGAKEEIDERLKSLCVSMKKEDHLDLPPITYNYIQVRMDKKERSVYDELARDRVLTTLNGKELDNAVLAATAAVLGNKLLQLSSGAVYDEAGGFVTIHSRKLDALEEVVEAAQGKPVLLFYAYAHEVTRIKDRFPKVVVLGEQKDPSTVITSWNAGEIPLMACHPASAGHGLNLQGASNLIVWFSLPYNLEYYQQANARLYRMGQKNGVIVHHIVCEGTLDEKVGHVLSGKEATQDGLLAALKGYVSGDVLQT